MIMRLFALLFFTLAQAVQAQTNYLVPRGDGQSGLGRETNAWGYANVKTGRFDQIELSGNLIALGLSNYFGKLYGDGSGLSGVQTVQTNISYLAVTNAPWQIGAANLTNWASLSTNVLSDKATTNASDLTTGTLADARLSTNVPLLSVSRELTNQVNTTGSVTSSGFYGNGAGLTNVTGVTSGALTNNETRAVTFAGSVTASNYFGKGAGLSNVWVWDHVNYYTASNTPTTLSGGGKLYGFAGDTKSADINFVMQHDTTGGETNVMSGITVSSVMDGQADSWDMGSYYVNGLWSSALVHSSTNGVTFSVDNEGNTLLGGSLIGLGQSNYLSGNLTVAGTNTVDTVETTELIISNHWNAALATNIQPSGIVGGTNSGNIIWNGSNAFTGPVYLVSTNIVGASTQAWAGPTNSIALGNGYTPLYFYSLTNHCSVTNLTGLASAGEWTASMLLTNGTDSNITFRVEVAGIRVLGGMTNTAITIPAGLTCDVAFASQTNGINCKRAVAILSNN